MIIKLEELPKIRQAYELAKELTRSPVPIVQDNAVLVLAILHDLRNHVDPDYTDNILEYE